MPSSEYVWVQDAVKEYRRSRAWLDEQVRHGKLSYAKFEGDKRVYLMRAELDAMFGKPIEEGRRGGVQSDAG